jgi:hypothetical protein
MKQPNEYWLKYMLLFSGLRIQQIPNAAELYGMQVPSVEYLRFLNAELSKTKPTSLRIENQGTRSWARGKRVLSMALDSPEALKARDILGNNRCRPVLEALLISDMPMEDVVKYSKEISGVGASVRTAKTYKHYFWNRDLLSVSQWYEFLKGHPRGKLLRGCYDQGPEYTLWKLGYRVEIGKEAILRGLLHESSMRFFETSQRENDKETAMTAKLWSEQIFKSIEILDRSGDAAQQVLSELKEIAIRLGKRDISSMESLEDGSDDE